MQDLQRRMAQQDAALFYAKAALAAEIRERQTAEQELQRAMEQERFAVAAAWPPAWRTKSTRRCKPYRPASN